MSPAKRTAGPVNATGADRAYIAQQPPDKRALLEKLRVLVQKGAPAAVPAIKWGVAVYSVNGKNVCALAAFKDHVAINFFAPSAVFLAPSKKHEGAGQTNPLLEGGTAPPHQPARLPPPRKAAGPAPRRQPPRWLG